ALIQECVAKAESIQSYPTGYGGGIFVTGSGEYDAPTLKLNLECMNIFENIADSGELSLYVVMTKVKECSTGVTICCPLCGAASLLRERSAWKYDQLSPEQHQVLDDHITETKTMNEDDIRRILVFEHQMQENEDEIPYDDQESRAIVVLAQLREAGFMKAENQRISAQLVPLANSSIQPATQALVPQVIQNLLENSQKISPRIDKEARINKKEGGY
ncbi:MAG: hypothetical protein EZS28_016919, partial [Streblomastix strix]